MVENPLENPRTWYQEELVFSLGSMSYKASFLKLSIQLFFILNYGIKVAIFFP